LVSDRLGQDRCDKLDSPFCERRGNRAGEIASSVNEVARAVDGAKDGVAQTSHAAGQLATMAKGLDEMVGRFKL
jgi:methyl-accepting chemotaxis protein